jgi:hypothetical protein
MGGSFGAGEQERPDVLIGQIKPRVCARKIAERRFAVWVV